MMANKYSASSVRVMLVLLVLLVFVGTILGQRGGPSTCDDSGPIQQSCPPIRGGS
uniref:BLN2 n=1 Tax=Hordeum vulgare subsp. vulgare TaxID=112509 RepID=B8X458_HORVV|nr:BLN2 [Hordeum vulgare subsp. vulgare]ACJ44992.1 BLN2 [Hordeum vulgare subsp. vulgare]ACJ44993.1 BLN2 [Hordeum vulgare subsp. vulgare]ACJ44994.1 BLN2 [Hordeum vulgare subsp. vulgare]ACJ44995.1 BLN2 [Hordeum vulgare subsp. vulgare]